MPHGPKQSVDASRDLFLVIIMGERRGAERILIVASVLFGVPIHHLILVHIFSPTSIIRMWLLLISFHEINHDSKSLPLSNKVLLCL